MHFPEQAMPIPGSWVDQHVQWIRQCTHAPLAFHVFSALATYSTALGRAVACRVGPEWVFPNCYVLLLGKSGDGKTTAISAAARHLGGDALMARPGSSEGFYQELVERSDRLWKISEFGAVVARLGRDYMGGIMEDLADLWDCPKVFRPSRLKGGEVRIEQPYLVILGATTHEWLEDRATEQSFRGGTYSRVWWVQGEREDYLADPPLPDPDVENALKSRVRALLRWRDSGARTRLMTLSPPARLIFATWARKRAEEGPPHDMLAGWWARVGVHCLKVATLYEYSATGRLEIGEAAMRRAMACTDWLADSASALLGADLAFSPWQKEQNQLLRVVARDPGGATWRELNKLTRLPAGRIRRHLQDLEAQGRVVEVPTGRRNSRRWKVPTEEGAVGTSRKVIEFPGQSESPTSAVG